MLGGSPCHRWSVARANSRETTPSGEGWELYRNYLIAKEKFRPDFFLYENNKSIAQPIKDQISTTLGVELMEIDAALVSAQKRERIYGFNWKVEQPVDRGILLRDVLLDTANETGYEVKDLTENEMVYMLRTVGGSAKPRNHFDFQYCSYAWNPKSSCVLGNWSKGVPYNVLVESVGDAAEATPNYRPVYTVKDHIITVARQDYYINLDDGDYMVRKLTPIEAERLQTLPDGYTSAVSTTQRLRGLGNGWCAEVIIHILRGALDNIPKDTHIQVLSMYDGIGTGRYCLDKMGFTNVEYHAVEIDKHAMRIATNNYSDIIQHGDAFRVRDTGWCLSN